VSRIVVLDSGPLGKVTHRGGVPPVDACKRWLFELLGQRVRVVVPEICDYETRRELLRAGKVNGIARLDALEGALEYLPLTTAAMRRAAHLWAEVRKQGQPTADEKALDADVILAAQALTMDAAEGEIVVATANVGHLSRLVAAELWQRIH
jgi:predicted nucleic acid-binding protein